MRRSANWKRSVLVLCLLTGTGSDSYIRPNSLAVAQEKPAAERDHPRWQLARLSTQKSISWLDRRSPLATASRSLPMGSDGRVAVDVNDNIWTFNRSVPPIQVYRPDGRLVRAWVTKR